jgi:hypothetical protein
MSGALLAALGQQSLLNEIGQSTADPKRLSSGIRQWHSAKILDLGWKGYSVSIDLIGHPKVRVFALPPKIAACLPCVMVSLRGGITNLGDLCRRFLRP